MTSEENFTKMSRRTAIKTMLGAAAVVIAVPHLGGLNLSGSDRQENVQDESTRASFNPADEPFVILVGKDELRGFKGQAEYSVKDSALTQRIMGAFSESRAVQR